VFNIPSAAEFFEFAMWGGSKVSEVKLITCNPATPSLADGLVWNVHLDESRKPFVRDSSPFKNHAYSGGAPVDDSKFCRGRAFKVTGPQGLTIKKRTPSLEFGLGSFSIMGWAKFNSFKYSSTYLHLYTLSEPLDCDLTQ
jgi:hypothetical protein